MGKIVVTGANGFIGLNTLRYAKENRRDVVPIIRRAGRPAVPSLESLLSEAVCIEALNDTDIIKHHLYGAQAVIHLAAKLQSGSDRNVMESMELFKTNVLYTEALAGLAVEAGVKKFVYVSSIGVNGDESSIGKPFTPFDAPNPHNLYALSKYCAENMLKAYTGKIILNIVRPPSVIGLGATGSFGRLVSLIRAGVPIPVGKQPNRRSLIGVRSLSKILLQLAETDTEDGQIFTIADDHPLSTREIACKIANSLDLTPRCILIPNGTARSMLTLASKDALFKQLFGSLEVDNSLLKKQLGIISIDTLDAELSEMAGGV